MRRSDFVKEVAGSINKLMIATEEEGKILSPEEFVNFIVDLFNEKGILNPTHFLMDADNNLHQVTGWEPEETKDEAETK